MKYETAKKLKEAYFPQDWIEFENHDSELLQKDWRIYSKRYSPSLSKLIEACGDDLSHIKKHNGNWWAVTHSKFDESGNNYEEQGITPEEAVANLWLALQKKKAR